MTVQAFSLPLAVEVFKGLAICLSLHSTQIVHLHMFRLGNQSMCDKWTFREMVVGGGGKGDILIFVFFSHHMMK